MCHCGRVYDIDVIIPILMQLHRLCEYFNRFSLCRSLNDHMVVDHMVVRRNPHDHMVFCDKQWDNRTWNLIFESMVNAKHI